MIVTKENDDLKTRNICGAKEVPALFMREEAVMYFGHDIIGVEAEGASCKRYGIGKEDILKYTERENDY